MPLGGFVEDLRKPEISFLDAGAVVLLHVETLLAHHPPQLVG